MFYQSTRPHTTKKRSPPQRNSGSKTYLHHTQNFLRSTAIVKKLLDKTTISGNDHVYDIGAGTGVITRVLAKRCKKVIAIEKDTNLFHLLQKKFSNNEKVTAIHGDFLSYTLPQNMQYSVFANIPFNITADIVRKLVIPQNPPQDSWIIMQKQAAQRFCGIAKTTQIAVVLYPLFTCKVVKQLQRSYFSPQPNVDTVLMHIHLRNNPLINPDHYQQFRNFILYSFNQWKPSLQKALQKIISYHSFKKIAKRLGFSIKSTPTDLTKMQWITLYRYFVSSCPNTSKSIINNFEELFKKRHRKMKKLHRTRGS